ncbi:hypothetical protein N5P37_009558 [Trichoderma harzianum]|nr:hypothetical protein N5P37_009558 [Trichoderma harzianum]
MRELEELDNVRVRPATQVHAFGRCIFTADQIHLHLLLCGYWTVFVKLFSGFLSSKDFWKLLKLLMISISKPARAPSLRRVEENLLYTYACQISTKSNFFIAIRCCLLVRNLDGSTMAWAQRQHPAREIISQHDSTKDPPSLPWCRASLIALLIGRKQFLFSEAYFGEGNDYSSFFRYNLAWTAAVTTCMVLILTAMQVCVAINGSKTALSFYRHNMSSQCWHFWGL